jgi:hypothetical protein
MIEKSGGKFVMFIDADMILSPSLIENCVFFIEKNNYSALHIPEVVLGKKFFSKVRRFERGFYNGTSIDGARFFLKDVFIRAGGFDESMSGPEDWDIDKKIKQIGKIGLLPSKIYYNWESYSRESHSELDSQEYNSLELNSFIRERGVKPEIYGSCIYHNESEFDLKKYLSKKGYYAKSFEKYINKWGSDDPDIKKQFGLWYRYFGVFIENGKWLHLLRHSVLTAGMYFLRVLVGITFITGEKKR